MSIRFLFIGVDSLPCKSNQKNKNKKLDKILFVVLIMNFILDFLGYLFLSRSIVGLKLNGQQKVKHFVQENDLFIYVL
jgi:hypothetical protein